MVKWKSSQDIKQSYLSTNIYEGPTECVPVAVFLTFKELSLFSSLKWAPSRKMSKEHQHVICKKKKLKNGP